MEVIATIHPKELAAKTLSKTLSIHVTHPILLMVSGGSALSFLDLVERESLGPHITLIVLDERFSNDPTVNNFLQLSRTDFYAACTKRGVNTITTVPETNETLEHFGKRFDRSIREWREKNPSGAVITTMGIGPDAHTAGILPGEHGVVFDDDSWSVAYSVPEEVNPYTNRVTVTYTFLQTQVTEAVVYAVGKEKYQLIQKLWCGNSSLLEAPISIFKKMSAVTIITDDTK